MFEVVSDKLRVLDFDLENRPLSYLSPEWTSAEITAIGWSWIGSNKVEALLLRSDGKYQFGREALTAKAALAFFASQLIMADYVTGHYILKHDLPILNGALMEVGLPPLPNIMAQDTCIHTTKVKDLSRSQENLASMFGMAEAKHHMTQTEWREANRLNRKGLAGARKRVVDDVIQHKALRAELLKRGLLHGPSLWRSRRAA